MSPLTVRRYRAERLLREEFETLRGKVLGVVRGRLRASGVSLDVSDLEACYAQAWQGLYEAMLAGEVIANPPGWLVLATFRRAIEEHRSRHRSYPTEGVGEPDGFPGGGEAGVGEGALEHDFAGELDNRIRLRQLFEGLRGRLSKREQQAAALCYLQGMSRAEAAARMEISESRMRKLMEGHGAGRPGVAGKVGELVEAIREGSWCEEQGSLMRGYAFGVLDPEGERYRLALAHRRECPACRAYIRSLRGLAVVLPAHGLMPGVLGVGVGAAAGAGAGAHASTGHGSTGHAGASASAGVGAGGGGVGAGASVGAASAGGAAGGGWFLAGGGVGAKLAVSCLFVAFGAGCVALTGSPIVGRHAVHHRHVEHAYGARTPVVQEALSSSIASVQPVSEVISPVHGGSSTAAHTGVSTTLLPAAKARREFGPEQALAGNAASSSQSTAHSELSAKAASSGGAAGGAAGSSSTGKSTSAAPREFTSTATQASGAAPQARSSSSQGATTGSGGGAGVS
jgi:DNA-directed RNA polymerase specialized sigma24 family protein